MALSRQLDECRRLRERNRQIMDWAGRISQELDAAQLVWDPGDGSWSIGRIFEHLCVANSRYLEKMRPFTRASGPLIESDDAPWRPTMGGALLLQALVSRFKLPAPGVFRPPASPRPHVAAIFIDYHREIQELLQSTARFDWSRIRVPSPVTGLFKTNLGDCYAVLVSHAERHLPQIEQVRKKPGFPLPPEST